jgi:hypothetical protein
MRIRTLTSSENACTRLQSLGTCDFSALLGAVAGRRVAPEAFSWMLHVGIFVVWIPTVLVGIKSVGNTGRKDYCKLVLRGSPEWMRYMVYGFGSYAMVNFAIFFFRDGRNRLWSP